MSTVDGGPRKTRSREAFFGRHKGKTLSPGEDFYFDGAEHRIHGWVVKPPGFKEGEKKKWPVVLLIHGGPQGAWEDQWSTRWNPQGMSPYPSYFAFYLTTV